MRRKERRLNNVKAYLCGAAPVQNISLEPHHRMCGYAARAIATAVPEETIVSKGPGEMTSGDGTSAGRSRQPPSLGEARKRKPLGFSAMSDDAVADVVTSRCYMSPPEEKGNEP